jgi:hypothetical protein
VKVVRRVASWNSETRKTVYTERKTSKATLRVAFAETNDDRGVMRRGDMIEAIFSSIWYCKDDLKAMKRDYLPTLKKMANGLPLDRDDEPRGLEHKTPKGNKRRHTNRLISIDAVLREQDRQWERKICDQGFIAELYIQASAHCRLDASLKAKEDEEYVRQHVLEEPPLEMVQEYGENKMGMAWLVDQNSSRGSTESTDEGSASDGKTFEVLCIHQDENKSYSALERKPTHIILTAVA